VQVAHGEEPSLTLLGLDIGTTHVKACAYDEEGRLLASARRRTPTAWLPDGGAEYHADSLEDAVFDAAAEAISETEPPQAIGVSSASSQATPAPAHISRTASSIAGGPQA